jgi:hypothetical protein
MMASRSLQQRGYLTSVYLFLHFQYNGWFFFSCMGLLMYWLGKWKMTEGTSARVFQLFAVAVLPTYFLSLLWWPLPSWLYVLVVLAALCQLAGWFKLFLWIRKQRMEIRRELHPLARILFILSATALTIKLFLQVGSVEPSLSKLAFGFRPIVIGYLHLAFLGVITLFILGYIVQYRILSLNKTTLTGIKIFAIAVIANELFLMIQGIADIGYRDIPYINEFLLLAALFLFIGMFTINSGQFFYKDDLNHKMPDKSF